MEKKKKKNKTTYPVGRRQVVEVDFGDDQPRAANGGRVGVELRSGVARPTVGGVANDD